jgi:hypothetical protein
MNVEGVLFGKGTMGKRDGGQVRAMGVNIVKLYYMHALKYHNETHYCVLLCIT